LKLQEQGFRVDTSNFLLAAWPTGKVVKLENNNLNLDTAYHTRNRSLTVFKLAPDRMVRTSRKLSNGTRYSGRFHALDHHDLAILKAEVRSRVTPAVLAPNRYRLSKLDPVMVLGFPGSISVRETRRAETAPSLGEIRKIEESIFVSAPIVPGNSGGPLIDSRGYVVGIASASYGASTVGGCIPIRHAVDLMPASMVRRLRRQR
jgi:S1-C subfamily serine protease